VELKDVVPVGIVGVFPANEIDATSPHFEPEHFKDLTDRLAELVAARGGHLLPEHRSVRRLDDVTAGGRVVSDVIAVRLSALATWPGAAEDLAAADDAGEVFP